MPITSSAKKALRGSIKKRVHNLRRKKDLDEAVKTLKKYIAGDKKDAKQIATMVSTAYKAIDKATKVGYLKKNTASRKKSRVSAMAKKATAK